MQQIFDRAAEDIGNSIHLEHVNVRVPDQRLATCEFYGELNGAKLFRKVAPWYAKRFGPAKPFKQRIITIASRADFEAALEEFIAWRAIFCDEQGELLPKYAPAPMISSFMRPVGVEDALNRNSIPVPKGPVEVW